MTNIAKNEQKNAIEPAVSLIPKCINGDMDAKETLARWCLPKIQRTIIMACSNKADADDLIQLAILRVLNNLSSYRGDAAFYSWVNRITINILKDFFKKKRLWRTREIFNNKDYAQKNELTPEHALQKNRLLLNLSKQLSKIKINKRLPLILSLAHGYTTGEISVMLEISEAAAKKRVQRGRIELLKYLKNDSSFNEIYMRWKNE
jgi:RNA polymerase sigma-70 factor (ECF subfamily)